MGSTVQNQPLKYSVIDSSILWFCSSRNLTLLQRKIPEVDMETVISMSGCTSLLGWTTDFPSSTDGIIAAAQEVD
ncbi:unnamed protein product [Enterobius vermicularis]|uniref:Ovule protein n=1 Tax=Enterobius vermicularis TaxID=51028 RepID=A0A0N4VCC0_ENTVE|nr:unnamed protein product [Enterobius vermicularis]